MKIADGAGAAAISVENACIKRCWRRNVWSGNLNWRATCEFDSGYAEHSRPGFAYCPARGSGDFYDLLDVGPCLGRVADASQGYPIKVL
jgi:hypothetical protein